MANSEQTEMLKKGVESWNAWRAQHPDVAVDLAEADLRGANLRQADLRGANLKGAKLQFANLSGADLTGADLDRARLQEVNLQGAKLAGAVVTGVNLMESNVQGADFEGADLTSAQFNEDVIFIKANLKGANLTDASGLNPMQIKSALFDAKTRLPDYLNDEMEDEDFLNSML